MSPPTKSACETLRGVSPTRAPCGAGSGRTVSTAKQAWSLRGATERSRVDQRWTETALQIMVEHTNESKPSQVAIIYQTAKRLESCYGAGGVEERRDRSGPTASFVPRTAGSWPCQPATMCTGAPDVRMRLTLVFRRPLPLRRPWHCSPRGRDEAWPRADRRPALCRQGGRWLTPHSVEGE